MAFFFNPGAWQGTATRLPGRNRTLNEAQARDAVKTILPHLSENTAAQVSRILEGKIDTLSASAKAEFTGMLDGYLKCSNQ